MRSKDAAKTKVMLKLNIQGAAVRFSNALAGARGDGKHRKSDYRR